MRKCVFAGTFDPPTLGHKRMLESCLKLFDEVVAAILVNPTKTPCFTAEQRAEMLRLLFPEKTRLRVVCAEGTAAELLRRENTKFYVRGIRNGIDLDYENANFYASRKLDEEIETIYLPCPQELLHVSSSMVRNCLRFSAPIDEYVTPAVKAYIENCMRNEREGE